MPKFVIAFHGEEQTFLHKIIEMDTKEASLMFFFKNHVEGQYSPDEEGYTYFREDFDDPDSPMGSILEL